MKSAIWLAFSILLYALILHGASLYLFTRGFLLTRLSLTNISTCETCTLPPVHSKLVFLIIDALRFDFISPQPAVEPSPYYHHVLSLPAELTAEDPTRSFIFNTFVDPPTTTLQRIKGITTGSLPTFVDMGSNFAASQISEDSLVLQVEKAGKKARKVAFMGDDTWTAVYPTSLSGNLSFPFDSFNVEDLHSVDEGVIANLLPLLQKNRTSEWDLLIGHFLGVDHVGHRLGPSHPAMKAKLTQMNEVLATVVDGLDDDTLLVVIGDHGMDRKGDHGGDSEHETSASTWIYSKSKPLSSKEITIPLELAPYTTFPGAPVEHRIIQQIDLLPTLSLLLGLPIPFNNLGTVIPELFVRKDGNLLEQALHLNARQIRSYLEAYRDSTSGGELDTVWDDIQRTWSNINHVQRKDSLLALYAFTRLALESCRSLWARFNVILMSIGLVALVLSMFTTWSLYDASGRGLKYWQANGWPIVTRVVLSSLAGAALTSLVWTTVPATRQIMGLPESVLTGFTFGSTLTVIMSTIRRPSITWKVPMSAVILVIHAVSFLSNSFTFWEDRIINFLLITSIVPFFATAFSTPQAPPHLRNRIFGFSALFALCVRLASISTVCREEQHPYCHVTFYASSTLPSPPILVLLACIPMALLLPRVLKRFLAISASDKGPAPPILSWGFRIMLLAATGCWVMEWFESSHGAGQSLLRAARTEVARYAVGLTILAGTLIWWFAPLCLEQVQSSGSFALFGFANSYGSSFLLLLLISYSIVNMTLQLTGQLTFAFCLIALFALLELLDSVRDLKQASKSPAETTGSTSGLLGVVPSIAFSEVVPVALLSLLAFYSTGHQATMQTIQWKTAFLLTPTLVYPFSPILVALNFFGPQLFFSMAIPTLAVWKASPIATFATLVADSNGTKAHPASSSKAPEVSISTAPYALLSSLRAAFGMSVYFSALLVSTAVTAAFLRRHLMVWKVFAPRFMAAGASILVVDLGLLLGVAVAAGRTIDKVNAYFQPILQRDRATSGSSRS
ncbi:hypothetical protein M422DRAFT_234163 [Sphaerobolus stellatus SS14]|uniref:Uncharacterized protein n=1 Tax=Sphaerobolus stellatus (strain SS14) TaxID=990650 RepID=A0A0C9V4J9_SPHS4|nr:hypothetical protein M422DRAFT_234163 [Sphaerobolus stellatus SS14]